MIERIERELWPQDWSLAKHTLCAIEVGSVSHGTYIPAQHNGYDDIDVTMVIVPPKDYVVGLKTFDHWMCIKDELDVVSYSVHKFAKLLVKNNPNILCLLYIDKALGGSIEWRNWRGSRDAFLSQRALQSLSGYAYDQLTKLAKPNAKGYMGEERKALFAKYGYDIKNAAHCVRLLRMGAELAETGELHVDRTNIDADEIKEIKTGGWSIDRVQGAAKDGFAKLQAHHANLPPEPDFALINELVVDTCDSFWLLSGDNGPRGSSQNLHTILNGDTVF